MQNVIPLHHSGLARAHPVKHFPSKNATGRFHEFLFSFETNKITIAERRRLFCCYYICVYKKRKPSFVNTTRASERANETSLPMCAKREWRHYTAILDTIQHRSCCTQNSCKDYFLIWVLARILKSQEIRHGGRIRIILFILKYTRRDNPGMIFMRKLLVCHSFRGSDSTPWAYFAFYEEFPVQISQQRRAEFF